MAYKFNPFTSKLEEYGPILTGTGTVSAAADGTAALPGIAFTNDLNTGIYRPGADQLALSTNGTGRLFVDSSGNVSIGATGAESLLTVRGTNARILVRDEGAPIRAQFDVDSTNSLVRVGSRSSHPFVFTVQDTERARIDSSGTLRVKGAGTGGVNDAVQLNGSAPANSLLLDASGRLLVGTSTNNTTFNSRLQVKSDNTTASAIVVDHYEDDASGGIIFLAKSRSDTVGTMTVVQNGDTLGEVEFWGADGTQHRQGASIAAVVDGAPGAADLPSRLVFSVTQDGQASPTERMRINSSGAQQSFSANDVYRAASEQGAGTSFGFYYGYHSATTTQNGTVAYVVYTNGNVVNTNNSYAGISDIKLKENIVDASSQWSDIKSLQVRNYNLKEGQTHKQIGLIAQEVELVSPGLVSESPDRDAEGNDLGTVTKSVNYSVLYMKAVKALQEAMERIEQLEQRLTDAGIA